MMASFLNALRCFWSHDMEWDKAAMVNSHRAIVYGECKRCGYHRDIHVVASPTREN